MYQIKLSKHFTPLCQKYKDYTHEVLLICALDSKYRIIKTTRFDGDATEIHFEEKKVLDFLKKNKASKVVFLHNHPSTSVGVSPSDIDNKNTYYYLKFLKKHGIDLIDHIVFNSRSFFSYYDSDTLIKYSLNENISDYEPVKKVCVEFGYNFSKKYF
jgi:DNA repair protein RadC